MAVTWTDEQMRVLEARNKNILVSAAAGSGKTAVLTERILRLVTEENIDIDRLLVVTFTNAAAGEMRERILKALEMRAAKEPENEHLQKQLSYIHNASITTIDSFCLNIVRQYFNEIDADPSFSVGDEGELRLIREDVMKELLERYYGEGNEEFLEFADDYSGSRGDEKIEELVLKLYRFSMSYPDPEAWLAMNDSAYDMEEKLKEKEWYGYIEREVEEILHECLRETDRAIDTAVGEGGPFTYEEALQSDRAFIEKLINTEDYEERRELLKGFKAAALSRKRLPETTEERKREQVKAIRDSVKKELKTLRAKYYGTSLQTMVQDMKKCSVHVRVLTELTREFIRLYGEAKREKNIIDFNDMEHMALAILTCADGYGHLVPSGVAAEVAEDIYEIMIDEYQDSNLVQETILNAISGRGEGKSNVFMVGDVKQSIYKFRLARPELFLEKYESYSAGDEGENKRISLSKNFRSRNGVLNGVNLLFKQLMSKRLGGIEYNDDNALYCGADYEDYGEDNDVELLLLDTGKDEEDDLEELSATEYKELEAQAVADRIKELMEGQYKIKDKVTGRARPVCYSDMAILLRSQSSYGEAYMGILAENGIPVRSQSGEGYFDAFEVETVLNMLKIIDNPRQDIPLGAVMKNMFSFSDEELAVIRSQAEGGTCFWECVRMSKGKKAAAFVKSIETYRELVPYTSIHDLLEILLRETGFGYFAASMKAGEIRLANLEMLKKKAVDFENTGYSGLFSFVRYIEKLKKYSVEQGEAETGAGGNFVTLLTIHKSKGLEFPVVFVGAMCKKFNKTDTRSPIVMHHELGIGLNYMDRKSGIKANTLIKESIGRRIEKENIAEELRVFYVALTRAGEKLILVGNGNIKGKIKKYALLKEQQEEVISPGIVFKATDYMDWVLMSLIRHRSFANVLKEMGESVPFANSLFEHPAMFHIRLMGVQEIVGERVEREIEESGERAVYEHWNREYVYDKELRTEIEELYRYVYPYKSDLELNGKISVSDIKHMFMKMYDDDTEPEETREYIFESEEKPVPSFGSKESGMSGTMRGTAYHRIFELLEYKRFPVGQKEDERQAELERQLRDMEEKKLAPSLYFDVVDNGKLLQFLASSTGKRMIASAAAGKLHREKQFVIGVEADKIKPEYSKEERVLVQGIIDAYFEEDGEIVIVDYKTDNIVNVKDLYARYAAQLDYYGMALEQITGKRVKEKILYSVKLGKEYIF